MTWEISNYRGTEDLLEKGTWILVGRVHLLGLSDPDVYTHEIKHTLDATDT
jgi:hypothetical protein